MSEEKPPVIPKWLVELQQRSWEPEILLSGIVLYGMFKVPDLLDEFLVFFKLNIFGNSQDIDNLIALFKMGIYWLIGGLILHLICRGIWIGMVGLSYTFPEGIREEKLKYKGRFHDKVNRTPAYEQIVIRLEKISSSLFSISFMLFMSLIGGYLFFLVLVILPFTVLYVQFDLGFSGALFDAFQIYVIVIVCLGLIALLDFLSLGYFRRFGWIARIYWPLHKVVSILTLSRFYRPIYYGVVTNFNRWVFFIFLLVFTVVSILGAGTITSTTYPGDQYSRLELWDSGRGYMFYNGSYDDQKAENYSRRASIPSDVLNGNVLKLFVVANITTEDVMDENMPLDSLSKAHPDTATSALQLMMVKNYYRVYIDDKQVEIQQWYFHYKTQTSQRGYLAYIDISDLSQGIHHIKLRGPEGDSNYVYAEIPFYRDLALQPQIIPIQNPPAEESRKDFQPKPFSIRE